jgi:hypothetical protein
MMKMSQPFMVEVVLYQALRAHAGCLRLRMLARLRGCRVWSEIHVERGRRGGTRTRNIFVLGRLQYYGVRLCRRDNMVLELTSRG